MRIVGGAFKGRVIKAPPGRSSRPTADRVRESIFNVLAHSPWAPGLSGARVIDLFAGSGALGLEALSRGAEFCLFVDSWVEARRVIADNAAELGLSDRISLARHPAERLPPVEKVPVEKVPVGAKAPVGARSVFDLAFLDPPYHQDLAPAALAALMQGGWLTPDAVIVLEIGGTDEFRLPEELALLDDRRWGPARVLFLHSAQ